MFLNLLELQSTLGHWCWRYGFMFCRTQRFSGLLPRCLVWDSGDHIPPTLGWEILAQLHRRHLSHLPSNTRAGIWPCLSILKGKDTICPLERQRCLSREILSVSRNHLLWWLKWSNGYEDFLEQFRKMKNMRKLFMWQNNSWRGFFPFFLTLFLIMGGTACIHKHLMDTQAFL